MHACFRRILALFILFHLHAWSNTYKYSVGACAIFQNEGRFLKEWIEYHKLIGVDHFYLYNNLSTDNFMEILQPYIEEGWVELREWAQAPTHNMDWSAIQSAAYMDAIRKAREECYWLAFIDLDEFLVPVKDYSLKVFLARYDMFRNNSVGAVCVNWQLYGTSGVLKVPEDKLSIEVLLKKAPWDYHENLHVKSIVHPYAVHRCNNAHTFILRKGYIQVNPDFVKFESAVSPYVAIGQIRLNHYWTRDEEYFWTQKMPRRNGWHEGGASVEARAKTLNTEEDPVIMKFVPKLRKKMKMY